MRHYTREELDRFRHKDMGLFSRFICTGHLVLCSSCRNLLKILSEDDALLNELREHLSRLQTVSCNKYSTHKKHRPITIPEP